MFGERYIHCTYVFNFYTAQYPVRFTLCQTCSFRHELCNDYSLPQPSIARYSLIQLSEPGHRGENENTQASNPARLRVRYPTAELPRLALGLIGLQYCALSAILPSRLCVDGPFSRPSISLFSASGNHCSVVTKYCSRSSHRSSMFRILLLLLLPGLSPSSGVAGVVVNIILPLCPVQFVLLLQRHTFLFYTSLPTWFSVFLSVSFLALVHLTFHRSILRIRIRINLIFTHVAVDTNNILQYSFKHEIIVCKSMNIIYCTI